MSRVLISQSVDVKGRGEERGGCVCMNGHQTWRPDPRLHAGADWGSTGLFVRHAHRPAPTDGWITPTNYIFIHLCLTLLMKRRLYVLLLSVSLVGTSSLTAFSRPTNPLRLSASPPVRRRAPALRPPPARIPSSAPPCRTV